MKEGDRWGHEYRKHTQSVLQVDEKGVTEQWKRNGCLMKGTEVKWLASWGSHILSTFSHHLFCSKPSTLASRAEPLATVWGYRSPWWAPLEAPRRLSSSNVPSAHLPWAFTLASPLLSLLFCSNPSPGSLPSLVRLSAQGHFRATFPSVSASQNNSPLTHPLFHLARFIFPHITARHYTHFSLCLSPPTRTQAPRAWRQTDFAHFWVTSNHNSRDSACVA